MIKCGNCGKEHATVPEVQECFEGTAEHLPATKSQIDFAQNLLRERMPTGIIGDIERDQGHGAATEAVNTLSKSQASGFIQAMKNQPRRSVAARPKDRPKVGEGMYEMDGEIYKVVVAVHGSGHLYAKRLNENGFVYAVGALTKLRPEHKMSRERAAEFGKLYGRCVVCGAILTDERSIADGIGPVCGAREWW